MLANLRSTIFNVCFYAFTFMTALAMTPLTFLPPRRPAAALLRLWAKGVVLMMRLLAGIRVEVRGVEHVDRSKPLVLAGKHQSECDGIIVLSLVPDLAVIAMKELADYPFFGRLIRKLEMVLVDTCGGGKERRSLIKGGRAARAKDRSILIYPEGHLMAVGKKHHYKSGVYHLAVDVGLPVVPVATNIGLRWDRRAWRKRPGPAVVEFLPAIEPGPDKTAFMKRLETAIEDRTESLVQEHQYA